MTTTVSAYKSTNRHNKLLNESNSSPSSFYSDTKFYYQSLEARELGLLTLIKPKIMQTLLILEQQLIELEKQSVDLAFTTEIAIKAFIPSLIARLQEIVTRTMILELNIAKLNEELQGKDSQERFQSFVTKLENSKFIEKIYNEYPVLAECADEAIKQWSSYCFETLSRLQNDYQLISNTFSLNKVNIGQLKLVLGEQGDCHNNGRSVAIIEFTSGLKVVYKPRSMEMDVSYNAFLDWLNIHSKQPDFKTYKSINCQGYGWCEYVTPKALTVKEDAKLYYFRFGRLLAVTYLLGATDIHFENIIANGSFPIIIDLETLITPEHADSPTYGLLSTSMLPQRLWHSKENGGVDFSAISAKSDDDVDLSVFGLVNFNSDKMAWISKKGFIPKSYNIPSFDGNELTFENYIDDVLDGFKESFEFLQKSKDALLTPESYLPSLLNSPIRYITQASLFYQQLLTASYHPDNCMDKNKRRDYLRKHLEQAYDGKADKQHVAAELDCLISGNIPLFHSQPSTKNLYFGSCSIVENFFDNSGKQCLLERISSLSNQQFLHHTWLLTSVLTQSSPIKSKELLSNIAPKWPCSYVYSTEPQALINVAKNIGDYLVSSAIVSKDDVTWLGYQRTSVDWVLDEIGLDLYSGRLGPILFLAYLGKLSGEKQYSQIAKLALHGLTKRLFEKNKLTNLGFSGWGGYIYVLAKLSKIWDTPELYSYIDSALNHIEPLIPNDIRNDFMAGNAGCIQALLALAKIPHYQSKAVLLAKLCGDRLLNLAHSENDIYGWQLSENTTVLLGFSHGNSGIALALEALAINSNNLRYLLAAKKAITYENSHFCPSEKNWPDLRSKEDKSFMSTWCHGAAGITLARCLMTKTQNEIDRKQDLEACIYKLQNNHKLNNHSLCHGLLGNLDIFHTALLHSKDQGLKSQFQAQLTAIAENVNKNGWLSAMPTHQLQPDFMTGLSGMGYILLKFAAPEVVPNALALS